MPSTFSPNKNYELQATGENQGTWGILLNAALSQIDLNQGGRLAVTINSANVDLTDEQAENVFVSLSGTLTGNRDLTFPASSGGFFMIHNGTSGAFTVTAKPLGGTGVTLLQGATSWVFINPTTTSAVLMGSWTSGVLGLTHGGTGATSASAARTALGLGTIATQAASAVAITGGSITGITDLAVADGGTGASTAPNARTNLGLGTIATQNSNSVTITGGSITGITDLAIADGGTGQSTAELGFKVLAGAVADEGFTIVPSVDHLIVQDNTNGNFGRFDLNDVLDAIFGATTGGVPYRTNGGTWTMLNFAGGLTTIGFSAPGAIGSHSSVLVADT